MSGWIPCISLMPRRLSQHAHHSLVPQQQSAQQLLEGCVGVVLLTVCGAISEMHEVTMFWSRSATWAMQSACDVEAMICYSRRRHENRPHQRKHSHSTPPHNISAPFSEEDSRPSYVS